MAATHTERGTRPPARHHLRARHWVGAGAKWSRHAPPQRWRSGLSWGRRRLGPTTTISDARRPDDLTLSHTRNGQGFRSAHNGSALMGAEDTPRPRAAHSPRGWCANGRHNPSHLKPTRPPPLRVRRGGCCSSALEDAGGMITWEPVACWRRRPGRAGAARGRADAGRGGGRSWSVVACGVMRRQTVLSKADSTPYQPEIDRRSLVG